HADPALGPDLAAELARKRPLAAVGREGAGLDLLAQEGANLLAQFLGLRRQLYRVEAEAEIHILPRRLSICEELTRLYRRPRESGGPGRLSERWPLDSRFRGNDEGCLVITSLG